MDENVKKAKKNEEMDSNFRINYIYTLNIDELFKLNLDMLERFYNKEKRIHGYPFETMQNLVKNAGFRLDEEKFRIISCYSKEMIIDENREGDFF